MNRLYGMIAAVCICFALFMTLALSGRKEGTSSEPEPPVKPEPNSNGGGGLLRAREPGRALRLAIDTEPQTLDPISVVDTISDGVANKLYNKLVKLKHDSKGQINPEPDLAESMTLSADKKIYTFKLHKSVLFHNGREMKANDVVYSLKRLMSPISKRADLLFPIIKGSEAYYKANKPDEITHEDPNLGIKALDEYTVQIELNEPYAPFLQCLTTISCAVVPREDAEKKDVHLSRAPVGTGPFTLDPNDWIGNQHLMLKRNDKYFAGKPKLEGIKFVIYKDRKLHLQLFMAGQLDAAVIPNGHVKRAIEAVGEENVLQYPNLRTNYIGFGSPNGKWKDKADLTPYGTNKLLRQAMSLALDRDRVCHKILEDRAVPAIGILPPGMPGWKESRPPMKRDLEKARELLKQAGFPEGKNLPPIVMLIRNDEDVKNIAQVFQQNWEEIGVKVQLQSREWNRFLEEVENEPQPMFMLGWVADYLDPDNFLYVLFNTKQFGSPGNQVFYSNAKVDELTEKARTISEMDERKKLYEQVEDIILDETPWICTYHPVNMVLLRKEIKGIRGKQTALDTGTEFPQVDFKDVEISFNRDEKLTKIETLIGKESAFTGIAEKSKNATAPNAPVLQTTEGSIYILGMEKWPDGFEGKTVSMAGELGQLFDLAVYVKKDKADKREDAIGVDEGTDTHLASRRFTMKPAKLELLR